MWCTLRMLKGQHLVQLQPSTHRRSPLLVYVASTDHICLAPTHENDNNLLYVQCKVNGKLVV